MTTCYIIRHAEKKKGIFTILFCGITEITYQPFYQNWKLVRFNQKLPKLPA